MKPATIGRIVLFTHDTQTAELAGGNSHAGQIVPAVIVRAWSDTYLNLKVFTDGPNDIWVTSVFLGEGLRQWQWPDIAPPQPSNA